MTRIVPITMVLMVLVIVALLAYEWTAFFTLPAVSRRALRRGDRRREQKLLHLILRLPAVTVGALPAKRRARMRLTYMCMEEHRYQEAADECRSLLDGSPTSGSYTSLGGILRNPPNPLTSDEEAKVRGWLAECLHGLGQREDSKAERDLLQAQVEAAPQTLDVLAARGDAARQAKRWDDAMDAYQQLLDRLAPEATQARGPILVKMSLTCQNMGRTAEIAQYAERALACPLDDLQRQLAHRMAGLGLQMAGRLDEAQPHLEASLRLAKEAGNAHQVVQILAQLAGLQKFKGHCREALQRCREVSAEAPANDLRTIKFIESSCHRWLGQFDEALVALDAGLKVGVATRPSAEDKVRSTADLEASWILAAAGRGEAARERLQAAINRLVGVADARLKQTCRASQAWILAVTGEAQAANDAYAESRAALEQATEDRRHAQNLAALLGRAAVTREDWAEALDMWQRYADSGLEPLFQPVNHYYQGLCHQHLGHAEESLRCFQAALETGLETHHVALARAALLQG